MSRKRIVAIVAVIAVVAVIALVWRAFDRREDESDARQRICGTDAEIGLDGDPPNPRELFGAAYDGTENRQERVVGDVPARLNRFTTWVDAVERIRASTYVDGYTGDDLKVHVRVFNRAEWAQETGAAAFTVWNAAEGRRTPDIVGAPVLEDRVEFQSGETLEGDLSFYVADVEDVYVEFHGEPFGLSRRHRSGCVSRGRDDVSR